MNQPLLHSIVLGQGKPLLILHGFLGMLDNWKTIGNQLANDGFQVHLIDLRNHGNSFHNDEFNYDVMAYDIKKYCDSHQLNSCCILGHSMGGKVAMKVAVSYPNLVSKLVVVDIAPKSYPPHHGEILKGLSALPLDRLQSRQEADEALAVYVAEKGVRQFLLKNLYRSNTGRFELKCNIEVLAKAEAKVGENFSRTDQYLGETLFVRGENSGYIEDLDKLVIQNHFPKATLQTVASAGHWVHTENPKDFYKIVKMFLED
ncbi:MAG: alpha/beta fold hydrolase [Flavobacteriaceae bacterium]|nr:alpha/beta fold hydrolase [Flavobacteriaceae bacterium]